MHQKPKPSEHFGNHAELIEDTFLVYWKNYETKIVFEVHVRTKGWICFGFSANNGIERSDVFIGWIQNGFIYFSVFIFCLLFNNFESILIMLFFKRIVILLIGK